MKEWKELSRLPDDPAYWDALQRRISVQARPVLADESSRWTRAALWTSAAGAAAAVVLLLARGDAGGTSLKVGLAPADPLAVELLTSEQPPQLSTLVFTR